MIHLKAGNVTILSSTYTQQQKEGNVKKAQYVLEGFDLASEQTAHGRGIVLVSNVQETNDLWMIIDLFHE